MPTSPPDHMGRHTGRRRFRRHPTFPIHGHGAANRSYGRIHGIAPIVHHTVSAHPPNAGRAPPYTLASPRTCRLCFRLASDRRSVLWVAQQGVCHLVRIPQCFRQIHQSVLACQLVTQVHQVPVADVTRFAARHQPVRMQNVEQVLQLPRVHVHHHHPFPTPHPCPSQRGDTTRGYRLCPQRLCHWRPGICVTIHGHTPVAHRVRTHVRPC